MSKFTSADWLKNWEQSLTLSPVLRPCGLLAPLLPEGQAEAELLPIGRRDAYLLDLHNALFGTRLTATVVCPACGERLEIDLTTSELRADAPTFPQTLELEWQDYRAHFRLPNSRDLAAAGASGDIESARSVLLKRCIQEVEKNGESMPVASLPGNVADWLSAAMTDADPQALAEWLLCCPACEHHWPEIFDIGAYLLETLDHWAERTLDQVHQLAEAYGWTEDQVLSLSPLRRARYLARVVS